MENEINIVNEEECYKHFININEYISVEVMIPVTLDIIKLKAISKMTNDLSKMNGAITQEDIFEGEARTKRKYVRHNKTKPDYSRKHTHNFWTEEDINTMKELAGKGYNIQQIADEMEVPKSRIYYKIREQGIKTDSNIERNYITGLSRLPKSEIKKLIIEWKRHKFDMEWKNKTANKYGLSTNQMKGQIKYWKNKFGGKNDNSKTKNSV